MNQPFRGYSAQWSGPAGGSYGAFSRGPYDQPPAVFVPPARRYEPPVEPPVDTGPEFEFDLNGLQAQEFSLEYRDIEAIGRALGQQIEGSGVFRAATGVLNNAVQWGPLAGAGVAAYRMASTANQHTRAAREARQSVFDSPGHLPPDVAEARATRLNTAAEAAEGRARAGRRNIRDRFGGYSVPWILQAQESISGAFGAGAGAGAGGGGGAAGGGAGRWAGAAFRGARWAGGAAMGLGTLAFGNPWALAGAYAAKKTLVDPVVSTYGGASEFQRLTADRFVGASTGMLGMDREHATDISRQLTEYGQGAAGTSGKELNAISAEMMKIGMFDEIKGMDADIIVENTKKGLSLLRTIAGVLNDPDIKKGLDVMKSLRSAGVRDVDEMESLVRRFKSKSVAAGMDPEEMNKIGVMGMQAFQSVGMSGKTGMGLAVDIMSGYKAAAKAGLITGEVYQSQGGAEGMTKSGLSGTQKSLNTPLSDMYLMTGSSPDDDIQTVLQRFGEKMSSGNPLEVMGQFKLEKTELQNDAIAKDPQWALKQAQRQVEMIHGDPSDPGALMSALQGMGINAKEAKALLYQNDINKSPELFDKEVAGYWSNERDLAVKQRKDQWKGLSAMPYVGDVANFYQASWKEFSSGMTEVAETLVGKDINRFKGWLDEKKVEYAGGGLAMAEDMKVRMKDNSYIGLEGREGVRTADGELVGGDEESDQFDPVIRRIMQKATAGNKDARAGLEALKAGDNEAAMKAFRSAGITGHKTGSRREVELENLQTALDKGLITTTSRKATSDEPLTGTEADLRRAARTGKGSDLFGKLESTVTDKLAGSDRGQFLEDLGISEADLKDKTEAEVTKLVTDKSVASIEADRGEITSVDDAYRRLRLAGAGSTEQIDEYLEKSGTSIEEFTEQNKGWFDSMVQDEDKNIAELAKKIKSGKVDEPKKQQALDIDTSGLRGFEKAAKDLEKASKDLEKISRSQIDMTQQQIYSTDALTKVQQDLLQRGWTPGIGTNMNQPIGMNR